MHSKRVLIVDDDQEFLSEIGETLAMSGYDMIAVRDPREALKALAGREIDAALLDLRMPGMNGFELADELSRQPQLKNVPIIAMTGFYSTEMDNFMRMCGIRKCLRKPFNPLDVIANLEGH